MFANYRINLSAAIFCPHCRAHTLSWDNENGYTIPESANPNVPNKVPKANRRSFDCVVCGMEMVLQPIKYIRTAIPR